MSIDNSKKLLKKNTAIIDNSRQFKSSKRWKNRAKNKYKVSRLAPSKPSPLTNTQLIDEYNNRRGNKMPEDN